MPTMRVFYVVYAADHVIATCLDAIRLLCDPNEKARAHVTLRGPYLQRLSMQGLSTAVTSRPVCVNGVGNFFEGSQNTVFLRCDSPSFREVWSKKDYPGYNPHITLYDGTVREFAAKLVQRLSRLDLEFSFMPTRLEPLVSARGQRDGSLLMHFDYCLASEILQHELDARVLKEIDDANRLQLIERTAEWLVSNAREREPSVSVRANAKARA
jgi:hypothetical protein